MVLNACTVWVHLSKVLFRRWSWLYELACRASSSSQLCECLHDAASFMSWLVKLAREALDELARRASFTSKWSPRPQVMTCVLTCSWRHVNFVFGFYFIVKNWQKSFGLVIVAALVIRRRRRRSRRLRRERSNMVNWAAELRRCSESDEDTVERRCMLSNDFNEWHLKLSTTAWYDHSVYRPTETIHDDARSHYSLQNAGINVKISDPMLSNSAYSLA